MNKFKFYFILLLAGIAMVSCNKSDDEETTVVVRDYKEQYKADKDSIENYLKKNYIKEVTANYDIVIEKIPAGGTQTSIWDQKDYPLESREVYNRDVNYTVYYLTLRKGTGEAPCNTDRIYASYTGNLLNGTVFDTSYGYGTSFELFVYSDNPVIDGWSEIFPKFRTGTSTTSADGVITYDNYGAGVMFLPSGLAYYSNPKEKIPSYSCLVFSFKLFGLLRLDHDIKINGTAVTSDPDGIPDYFEDVNKEGNNNGIGYVYDLRDKVRYPNPPAWMIDDTDGDGIADFLDVDDDGDGYTTRFETTKPTDAPITGISKYYPFDPILDNPSTPNVDESEIWGIPAFGGDYTSPGRLRIHVDKNHHSVK
ncbi:FKBP-type peptidyl-prolyl cis-trans isomerase [Flavobacterium denitrificans]|uniref:FKBP-type peptidyl-prolyl cis-trans isomerase n=1 Tax=Flavobacterium denitrificans TaxID=281361 RepID=UPI00041EAED6|nr:FKBP-type peptidyl-prolyl cis-trans isomerase [Flavobacterium denitrificans]